MIKSVLIAALGLLPLTAFAQDAPQDAPMKITVTMGETVLAATLDATPAARDFAAMLPLTLTLSDYHGIEKVADLGRRLDSTGMPGSYTPKAGDITQYAPWQNLALFLKPFQNSAGLVRLGQFDGDFSILAQPGEVSVTIAVAD